MNAPPTERGIQALKLICERFSVAELPPAFQALAAVDFSAHDIQANLSRHFSDGQLTEATKLIVGVAVAATVGARPGLDFFRSAAAAKGRSELEATEAASIAGICSIFNGYYRFRDHVPHDQADIFSAFRAPVVANSFSRVSLPPTEIEAICIAVSSVNGCHACVASHLKKARNLGMTDEQIDEAIRASAVAFGISNLLGSLA